MQSSFMEFEFGKLHYQHAMSDKEQTILFLHAFHSSAGSYSQVCDLLKDQFNLVCLDFPGHGLSERINVDRHAWYYSLDGFTRLLIEFVECLKLDNLFIVGDSVGGNCAVRAMSSLNGLKGLIIEGSVQADSKDTLFALHHSTGPINFLFQKEFTQEEFEVIAAAYVDPNKNEQENFKRMLYDVQHTDPNCREQFASHLDSQAWVNELQLIQKCSLPLMYILGLQDGFIDSSKYKKFLLEAGLQESQIHVLDQARHVPHLDDPELCAKLIVDFIKNS